MSSDQDHKCVMSSGSALYSKIKKKYIGTEICYNLGFITWYPHKFIIARLSKR